MHSSVYATVGCPSIHPSVCPPVCPIDQQYQRRPVSFLLSALQLSIDIDRSIAAGAVLQARRRSAANAGSVMLTADEGGAIQTCIFGDDGKIRSRRLDYWDMKEGESKRLGAVEIKAALSSVRVYFTGISAHSCIAAHLLADAHRKLSVIAKCILRTRTLSTLTPTHASDVIMRPDSFFEFGAV